MTSIQNSAAHRLPVDEILPQLRTALGQREAAVLQAPPGAGKTTRIPPALLGEPWLAGKRIVMLEPRRLAAAHAARFMAASFGEEVGRTVGYAIRFERRVSSATRIEVVTEGILTRRLQSDPTLEGVGLVIFDEFHERHLQSDLALALCRDAQLGLREDLRILVMSATLDAAPVSALLGDAPLVTAEGRSFPVEIRHLAGTGSAADDAARAVRRALRETEGDLLVFLPGAGEIRRCAAQLAGEPAVDAEVLPLYGELPFAEQQKAIRPAERRRVVLSTNIAETSLTIEGVRTVIDSGYARQPRFNAAAGIPRLETVRISRASADQRAGRAGRLAPGVCYRLWSEGEHGALLPFGTPEIRSGDLTGLALELARWGIADAAGLAWLDPPPEGALVAARDLLRLLGALDPRGALTPLGEEMAALPVHPRLARLLVEGRRRGAACLACDLAALLSERQIVRRSGSVSPDDLADQVRILRRFRRGEPLPSWVDAGACAVVERAARHLARSLGESSGQEHAFDDDALVLLLAPAFPDRIGMEREPGSGRYLLSGGKGGRFASRPGGANPPMIVAVEIEGEERGEGLIRKGYPLGRERFEELFGAEAVWRREVVWDAREERVVSREVRRFGALTLGSRPWNAPADATTAAVLDGVRQLGIDALDWSGEGGRLAARVRFAARALPEENWPDFSPQGLTASLEAWLAPFLDKVRTRADLRRLDLLPALEARLGWSLRRRLDDLAPTHIPVPSGHRIPVDYGDENGGEPVLAVKLQELFGLAETPRIAAGRVPVLLHLLSPARRPIQVTRDLRSFWDNAYPEVRRELKGRYPKHPWPDDPWNAEPTRRTKAKTHQ